METYNKIGKNYNVTRKPDSRIVDQLISLLDIKENSIIADVGAGTGNYSYEVASKNIKVKAIEPSDLMLENARKHKYIEWIKGNAESIPLDNESVDGIICTLATHHFNSIDLFLEESYRILKPNRNLVIFTFDPRLTKNDDWIKFYFNNSYYKASEFVPERKSLLDLMTLKFHSIPEYRDFHLPQDITDRFFYSAWNSPEKYFDADFRNGISVFAQSKPEVISEELSRLQIDLDNGTWDEKYGKFRTEKDYEGGYYFIRIEKAQ